MEAIHFTDVEKSAFRKAYAQDATDDQFALFISHCERRALLPGAHVILQIETRNVFDPELQMQVPRDRVVMITTLAAMTLLADRTGKYDGQGPITWHYRLTGSNAGFVQSDIPLGEPCHAASVDIYRKDLRMPAHGVARYDACVQTVKETVDGVVKSVPNHIWSIRGEEMTGKCAIADGFRKAFPAEVGSLYIAEELQLQRNEKPVATVLDRKIAEQDRQFQAQAIAVMPQTVATLPVNQEPAQEKTVLEMPLKSGKDPMAGIDKLTHELNRPTELNQAVPAPALVVVPEEPSIFDAVEEACTDDLHDAPAVLVEPLPVAEPEAVSNATDHLPEAPEVAHADLTPAAAPVLPAAPVQDPATRPLTVAEHRVQMGRCTRLVRDVLQKAGKEGDEASRLFLPHLKKITGKASTTEMPAAQITELLDKFEAMTPNDLIKLLKAK